MLVLLMILLRGIAKWIYTIFNGEARYIGNVFKIKQKTKTVKTFKLL